MESLPCTMHGTVDKVRGGNEKREKGIELEHEFDTQQSLAVLNIWANPDPYIIFGKSSSLFIQSNSLGPAGQQM